MAGSIRAFVYTADSGQEYICRLDESTYEQVQLGFKSTLGPAGAAGIIMNRQPIKMRYINCFRQEGGVTIRRRFYIGNPSNPLYAQGGTIDFGATASANEVEDGEPWLVSSSIGEKRSIIGLRDTAKLDGDADGVA